MFNKICGALTVFFIGFIIGCFIDVRKETISVETRKVVKVGFEWVGKDDGVNGHTDHYWVMLDGNDDTKYKCSKEDYKIISSTDCKYEFYIHRKMFESDKFIQLKRIIK